MSQSEITLPSVKLGRIGPVVGLQGLGTMAMATGYYGATDEAEARATLDRALELGVTLYDTSASYGQGRNEEFIAPFVRGHRDRVVLATKFGIARRDGKSVVDNRPSYIRETVEGSLRRLGIETIDLLYMHRRDPAVPLGESIGVMAELVSAGKARFIGLSEVSAAELREAHAIHPVSALETEWSLFSREIEDEIAPAAAALGVGIVPYSPLGRGQLTGGQGAATIGADDARAAMPWFSAENQAANDRLIAAVRDLAAKRGASAAQIALAWLHYQAGVFGTAVVPIPGTRKPARVEENVGGARIVLTQAELEALNPLADAVRGDRGRQI